MEMMYEGAMLKLFSTELSQRLASLGMQMSGLLGQLHGDSKYTPLKGRMETAYLATIIRTVFAGTSEIQRTIMALRGLGLPSS